MTVAARVGLSVVGLGLVGVSAYIGSAIAVGKAVFAIPRNLHIANSPIGASGGSMTFRAAKTSWVCDSVTIAGATYHTKCVTKDQVPVAGVDWDDVVPISNSVVGSLGWTDLSMPWMFDIWARNAGGNALKGSGGVKLCTTSTNTISATAPTCDALAAQPQPYSVPATSYILVYVEGSNVAKLGLMDSNAVDSGSNTVALQYYDSTCDIHDPAKMPTVPACEHPGQIDSSIDKTQYKCQHGACQIGIGP